MCKFAVIVWFLVLASSVPVSAAEESEIKRAWEELEVVLRDFDETLTSEQGEVLASLIIRAASDPGARYDEYNDYQDFLSDIVFRRISREKEDWGVFMSYRGLVTSALERYVMDRVNELSDGDASVHAGIFHALEGVYLPFDEEELGVERAWRFIAAIDDVAAKRALAIRLWLDAALNETELMYYDPIGEGRWILGSSASQGQRLANHSLALYLEREMADESFAETVVGAYASVHGSYDAPKISFIGHTRQRIRFFGKIADAMPPGEGREALRAEVAAAADVVERGNRWVAEHGIAILDRRLAEEGLPAPLRAHFRLVQRRLQADPDREGLFDLWMGAMADAIMSAVSVPSSERNTNEILDSGLGGFPPLPGQEVHQERPDLIQFPP